MSLDTADDRVAPRDADDAPESAHDDPSGAEPTRALTRWSLGLVRFSVERPKKIFVAALVVTAVLGALMVRIQIDTDPENMLAADAPARVVNDELRDTFGGAETIVVGLFAEGGIDGEIIAATNRVHDSLTATDGVDSDLLVSVRTAAGDGWAPPADGDASALLDRIEADPLLGGNVVSADRDALAIFVALDAKSDAQPVTDVAEQLVASEPALADLELHVAGLPLAQEAFGDQMFVQMGVFAPLAGVAIFVLMLVFFRRLALVVPAMIVALAVVIWTMGLLIGTGNTVHIMSSMIPIFLMPIAILDSVHVISEFFDRSASGGDRRSVIDAVYRELAGPVASTSATTATGFLALALTPIPPVRVFGIFVAVGVGLAWLATLTLLPAMLAVARQESIDRAVGTSDPDSTPFARIVAALPRSAARRRRVVLGATGLLAVAAVPALLTLQINDNPVNWFRSGHEVRVATERLNDALPGTFTANLLIDARESGDLLADDTIIAVEELAAGLEQLPEVGAAVAYTDLLDGRTGISASRALEGALDRSPLASSLITDELDQTNIRVQLRSGDNQAMRTVLDEAEPFVESLPDGLDARWAGESHLNLVWQDEMVSGMIAGFGVTLVIVVGLLVLLFRSLRWALLAIAPVLWTVLVVYAGLGVLGRDIDMPVAVLSTMVLGIGVDFAIHFVERFRELRRHHGGDADAAIERFSGEPARALTRNAAIIAIGFSPLVFSSLVPYVVVGVLLASIIALSWLSTMVALPAAVTLGGSGADRPGTTAATSAP